MPCRKPRSKVRKPTGGAVTENGIRCGKWVLRSTKSRLSGGHYLATRIPSQVAPKPKRHHISSATSSQNSCTGATENPRKSNPNAAIFRYKGLPYYDLWKQPFNKLVATGALGHSNNQPAPDSDEEEAMSMSQAQGLEAGTSSGSRGILLTSSETMEGELFPVPKRELCKECFLKCQYCETPVPVPVMDILKHLGVCGNRSEYCMLCGEYFKVCEAHGHDEDDFLDYEAESSAKRRPCQFSWGRFLITMLITCNGILLGSHLFHDEEQSTAVVAV